MSVLEFDEVRACYGSALILDGVSLAIEPGESVALLGRNGAGKTTTALAVFAVPTVTAGVIRIGGQPLNGRQGFQASRKGVALVPQGRRILANLTVEDNLRLGSAAARRGPWTLDRVYDIFPDLRERRENAGSALSGGQQQMLAVGRALMSNPQLLILDEPSEGLAPVIVDELAVVLRELHAAGTSLLLIEQHLSLVRRVSDRYLVMNKGRVVDGGQIAGVDNDALRKHISV